jgi:hypothetical protein
MPKLRLVEFASILDFREAARNGFGDPQLATYYENYLFRAHLENAEEARKKVNNSITIQNLGDTPVPFLSFNEYKAGGLVKFGAPAHLDKLEQEFEQEIIKLGLMNKLPKPELTFNDRGLGNFVFDRAAQSLQYKYDYYSVTLERLVDDTEFVKVDDVDEDAPPRFVLIADGSEVKRRVQQQENGLPSVATSNKKVFAYTPRNEKLSNGVELYVSAGNYHFTGSGYLYSGIVVLLITKLLERAGVKVKINVVVGWISGRTDYRPSSIAYFEPDPVKAQRNQEAFENEISQPSSRSNDAYCAAIITAKNYNESLDRNLLALITSDPRFWQMEGYAACSTLGKRFGRNTTYGLVGRALKAVFKVENYKPEMKFKFCYGRVQEYNEVIGEVKRAIDELAQFTNAHGNSVQQYDPTNVTSA